MPDETENAEETQASEPMVPMKLGRQLHELMQNNLEQVESIMSGENPQLVLGIRSDNGRLEVLQEIVQDWTITEAMETLL